MPENPFKEAQEAVVETIKDQLRALVEGAAEDLEAFAAQIATDTANVVLMPDSKERSDLLAELHSQVGLLAEIHRIRLVNASNRTIALIIHTAVGVGLRAAGAAIPSRA